MGNLHTDQQPSLKLPWPFSKGLEDVEEGAATNPLQERLLQVEDRLRDLEGPLLSSLSRARLLAFALDRSSINRANEIACGRSHIESRVPPL